MSDSRSNSLAPSYAQWDYCCVIKSDLVLVLSLA